MDFIGNRQTLGRMLESGEIDAFFLPHPPSSVMRGETAARRLFADCQAEETSYYQQYGDFPIMHVIAIRHDLLEEEPGLALAIMEIFDDALRISRDYYEDPNWSRLAWGRHDFELERTRFSKDPWTNGFLHNRANLERFIRYSHDQAMIETPYRPETLVANETLNT